MKISTFPLLEYNYECKTISFFFNKKILEKDMVISVNGWATYVHKQLKK